MRQQQLSPVEAMLRDTALVCADGREQGDIMVPVRDVGIVLRAVEKPYHNRLGVPVSRERCDACDEEEVEGDEVGEGK